MPHVKNVSCDGQNKYAILITPLWVILLFHYSVVIIGMHSSTILQSPQFISGFVLGIETSCDETGLAIYHPQHGIVAEVVYSQTDIHMPFGGVVPELASRDHIQKLLPLLQDLLQKAHLTLQDLSGIAYTAGPGLIGALLVGACFARSLGFALNIPTCKVHHLEGHLLAPLLSHPAPKVPFVGLLVSGGHTMLVAVPALGCYHLLGETLDDAVGEAFDKIAKMLGLGYPGGALLAKLALTGDCSRFKLSRPMLNRPGCDFSFSGLKTQTMLAFQKTAQTEQDKKDLCASFEHAVVETLVTKCERAMAQTGYLSLVVAGGVGANLQLRSQLTERLRPKNIQVYYPPPHLCTDNGAMIAYAGFLRLSNREIDDLAIHVKARWPLSDLTAILQM